MSAYALTHELRSAEKSIYTGQKCQLVSYFKKGTQTKVPEYKVLR